MTRAELEAALEWERKWCMPNYTAADNYCTIFAAALREAWAEIDRLKAHLSNPLDEALNSGNGSYKP